MSDERIAPEVDREVIMDMVYDICSDLLPEDDKSMPAAVEDKLVALHHRVSAALQIEPAEQI